MIVGPVSKGTWHLASEDSVQLNKVCVCVCVCVCERERERENEWGNIFRRIQDVSNFQEAGKYV